MSYDLAKFKHGLEELRITLTDHQIEQLRNVGGKK